ncbi:cupin domain-containing protein [Streptomyces sp. NPDC059832]
MSGSRHARLDPYDGAGFYVVLKGSCWPLTHGGTPMPLGVGDASLPPHGTGHVLADSPVDAAAGRRRCLPFECPAPVRRSRTCSTSSSST